MVREVLARSSLVVLLFLEVPASGHRGFQTVPKILVQRLPAWLRGVLKVSGMLHGLVCKMFISLNQSSGSQSVPHIS